MKQQTAVDSLKSPRFYEFDSLNFFQQFYSWILFYYESKTYNSFVHVAERRCFSHSKKGYYTKCIEQQTVMETYIRALFSTMNLCAFHSVVWSA